jgi:hypothetical protein
MFLIIAYVFSTTKLEKGHNKFCRKEGVMGGELAQTMNAHMNK